MSNEASDMMHEQINRTAEGEPHDMLVSALMLAATAPDEGKIFDVGVMAGRIIERYGLSDKQMERAANEADRRLHATQNEANNG